MGVPTSEVGYTSATTGRGNHEVQDGHLVALDLKSMVDISCYKNGRLKNLKQRFSVINFIIQDHKIRTEDVIQMDASQILVI
jgi:hypothetical protein